jgi:hypothetical protein
MKTPVGTRKRKKSASIRRRCIALSDESGQAIERFTPLPMVLRISYIASFSSFKQ